MNVIGSRPDGWWRDRRAAMRGLVEQLDSYAAGTGDEVTVVLDSRPFEIESDVQVLFAAPRPNAADDEIARIVAADSAPGGLSVVTSDSTLAARVRERGADVISSGSFRRRLDESRQGSRSGPARPPPRVG
jgi:predicted RNA-binding protein with PIN domain